MAAFKCGIYNIVKDAITGTGADIRVCIKGFSDEAEYVNDLNGGDKDIVQLIEGERVVMAWDQITEELVHLKRITINKKSKIIVSNYIAKSVTVEIIPDLDPADDN